MKFANSSIEIVKKLSKVAIFAIPAKLGLNVIEKLFLGSKRKPGGLLAVFREVDKNKKIIKSGDKSMKEILAATGAMFLTSILLSYRCSCYAGCSCYEGYCMDNEGNI